MWNFFFKRKLLESFIWMSQNQKFGKFAFWTLADTLKVNKYNIKNKKTTIKKERKREKEWEFKLWNSSCEVELPTMVFASNDCISWDYLFSTNIIILYIYQLMESKLNFNGVFVCKLFLICTFQCYSNSQTDCSLYTTWRLCILCSRRSKNVSLGQIKYQFLYSYMYEMFIWCSFN